VRTQRSEKDFKISWKKCRSSLAAFCILLLIFRFCSIKECPSKKRLVQWSEVHEDYRDTARNLRAKAISNEFLRSGSNKYICDRCLHHAHNFGGAFRLQNLRNLEKDANMMMLASARENDLRTKTAEAAAQLSTIADEFSHLKSELERAEAKLLEQSKMIENLEASKVQLQENLEGFADLMNLPQPFLNQVDNLARKFEIHKIESVTIKTCRESLSGTVSQLKLEAVLTVFKLLLDQAEVHTGNERKKQEFKDISDQVRKQRRRVASNLATLFLEEEGVMYKKEFWKVFLLDEKPMVKISKLWFFRLCVRLRLRQRQYCTLKSALSEIPTLFLPSDYSIVKLTRDRNREMKELAGVVPQTSGDGRHRIESAHCTKVKELVCWWFRTIDEAISRHRSDHLKSKWAEYKRKLQNGEIPLLIKEAADSALNFKRVSLVYVLQLANCKFLPLLSSKTILPVVLTEVHQSAGIDLEKTENLEAYLKMTAEAVRSLRGSKLDLPGVGPVDLKFVSVYDAKFFFSLLRVKSFSCLFPKECAYKCGDNKTKTERGKKIHIKVIPPESSPESPVWDLEDIEVVVCVLHAVMRIAESFVRHLLRAAANIRGRSRTELRDQILKELVELKAFIVTDKTRPDHRGVKLDFASVRIRHQFT
jgi:hypothetical protein